jgi:hypothetical protein
VPRANCAGSSSNEVASALVSPLEKVYPRFTCGLNRPYSPDADEQELRLRGASTEQVVLVAGREAQIEGSGQG